VTMALKFPVAERTSNLRAQPRAKDHASTKHKTANNRSGHAACCGQLATFRNIQVPAGDKKWDAQHRR
jgi:hypothetical protein